MGNLGSNKHKQEPNLADWNIKQKIQEYNVWSSKNDPNVEIQQYQLNVHDEKSFSQQRQMYFLRKDHPYLVATKFFMDQSQGDFCSSVYKGKLFLERIPLRLCMLKDIPFPDVIHFLSQTLGGGQVLAKQYKPFLITEQHIGVNQQGIVKIWLNNNFQKTFASEDYCDEQIMVRKIIQIIDSNTQYKQLPRNGEILDFFYKQKPNINFNEALRKLEQYANTFNKGEIPNHLDCVSKAGGVHVLTSQQKAYEEKNKARSPVMVNQSLISHPPIGSSINMTQIPRENTVSNAQNPSIIYRQPISQMSKPQSNLSNSQAMRPISPQFSIPQNSQIKQPGTIIQRLSQPITERIKTGSLHQSNSFKNKNVLVKANSPAALNFPQAQISGPMQRVMVTQSAYPIPSPQIGLRSSQNTIRQISNRNSIPIQIQQQKPQQINIRQSQFKPLSFQQAGSGAKPINIKQQNTQRINQVKVVQKNQINQNRRIQESNLPIKFVRTIGPQVNASISEISSINPVNQVKKSYYTSERPFSQLRGQSINNTTVNFYNNFNPDSQAEWQQRPNTGTGNKNIYQNVYPTIPQQLKEQKDYIHQSPANTGSGGTFSFGNGRKDLKDGTSSQDFLAQLRTFKSYSPQKKQIQKQYQMLNHQQRARQQQRQRQAQMRQRQIQQQIQLQGKQLNPKIVSSNQKPDFSSQNNNVYQNIIYGNSPSKTYRSVETIKYENNNISPVINRVIDQNIFNSGSKTPLNNQGRTVVTLHSQQNSPTVKTPAQIKQGTPSNLRRVTDSLEQNLEMKYSMTQDSSYKVQWDPEILADLKSYK